MCKMPMILNVCKENNGEAKNTCCHVSQKYFPSLVKKGQPKNISNLLVTQTYFLFIHNPQHLVKQASLDLLGICWREISNSVVTRVSRTKSIFFWLTRSDLTSGANMFGELKFQFSDFCLEKLLFSGTF